MKGILAVRGGWGCARLLPHLDFESIRRHPKVLLGYSDVTALHLAIQAKTGLTTFHAPVGISSWPEFSVASLRQVVFAGEAATMVNPSDKGEGLVQTDYRVSTLTPGKARGRLLGGNLTVLSHLVGTPYLPEWDGAILFLEDIAEDIYRIDRMLTQLGQAGILKKISGVVFGTCKDCKAGGDGYGSLTLEEVLGDHLTSLACPPTTAQPLATWASSLRCRWGWRPRSTPRRGPSACWNPRWSEGSRYHRRFGRRP